MILVVTPTLDVGGSLASSCVISGVVRGVVVDIVSVQSAITGGACVEQMALPGEILGGVLQFMAPQGEIGGSLETFIVLDAALAETFFAAIMNTRKEKVAFYDNFPFTSLFKLGSRYYGTTETGLEELAGDTDLGAPIAALVRSGVHNLGTDARKVITDVYLEVRCPNGNVEVGIVFNEQDELTYPLDPIQDKTGMYFKRIKPGRGADGTHVQVVFRNQNGAVFDLQSIRLITQPKSRRL